MVSSNGETSTGLSVQLLIGVTFLAHCIALLVVGGVCSIAFVLWERFGARHPLIPFRLLTNRTVIVCFIIAILHPVAGSCVSGYLYTFLVVAGNQSVLSATRIGQISGFSGTLCAALAGVIVRYTRYLKPIIIFGQSTPPDRFLRFPSTFAVASRACL